MPRYFMHLSGTYPSKDDGGEIYDDLDCACIDAIRFLSEMLSDRAHELIAGDDLTVSVFDEQDNKLLEVNSSIVSVNKRMHS